MSTDSQTIKQSDLQNCKNDTVAIENISGGDQVDAYPTNNRRRRPQHSKFQNVRDKTKKFDSIFKIIFPYLTIILLLYICAHNQIPIADPILQTVGVVAGLPPGALPSASAWKPPRPKNFTQI
jgi:hypothetical protein